jgi:Domain of unknown function (DUF4150)
MSDTIVINNLSLSHKGSSGVSTATIPDVCKTPSPGGPIPLPYPNVSMSSSLDKGTTTVKVDGGNMAATKGSEYSMSSGDEPGTVGGVTSSTFKKESTWITYSFDVKLDGDNACRLTDKKFQNHKNTADMAGDLEPFNAAGIDIEKMMCDCVKKHTVKEAADSLDDDEKWRTCMVLGSNRHKCVNDKIQAANKKSGNNTMRAPAGADYDSDSMPSPKGVRQEFCRPDIIHTASGATPPIAAKDMTTIYEMKFQCADKKNLKSEVEWDPETVMGGTQKKCYKDIKLPGGTKKKGGVEVIAIGPTKENCP